MSDRKASDILLNIEKNINNIEKLLKLQDFQQKLIIDNFNKFFKHLDQKETKTSVEEEKQPQQIKESLIDKKNKLMTIQRTQPQVSQNVESDNNNFNFKVNKQNIATKPPENEIINKTVSVNDERQVPITQKLILFDGNPMVSAKVIIKNSNDEIVKTAETSASGRWQSSLVPGKYTINVSGKHSGSMLEFNQSFEVPPTSSPLEIPAPKVYKRKTTK